MAYCVASDVQSLLQHNEYVDTGNSQPTLTKVNDIIAQTDAEINSILNSKGIVTPITSGNALLVLKKYCSYGAACTIGMTYFGNADSVSDTQPTYYCDSFKEFKSELKEDPETLLGLSSNTLVMDNQVTDGTQTESEYNETQVQDNFKW